METKLCTKCQILKPISEFYKKRKDGPELRSTCKACYNGDSRSNYFANREKRLEQTSRYQREHPEQVRETGRRYYARHRDRRLESFRRYHQTHPEKMRAERRTDRFRQSIKRWRENNKERDRENHRIWDQNNPDKVIAKAHRRRVRKRESIGNFTAQEWADLKAKYNFRCLCCGRTEPEITLTADHVVPLVEGGTNDIGNIQPLCGSCNSRKHTKTIDYR